MVSGIQAEDETSDRRETGEEEEEDERDGSTGKEIGRASCRERV